MKRLFHVLLALAAIAAFGAVSEMDYQDAMMTQAAYQADR